MILRQPIHTNDNVETTEFNWHEINFESGWPFVSAILGQMAHLIASITLNSTRSGVMEITSLTQWKIFGIPITLSRSDSISFGNFLPSVLLWLVVVVVVGVGFTVVVVAVVGVVVESSSIVKLSLVVA
ncbi:hypothetical protein Tco_1168210 [Tanacetum coccineum]